LLSLLRARRLRRLLAVAADGFLRNPLRGDGEGAAPVARGELAGRFQNRPRATALTLGLALRVQVVRRE
jgi:hypothetical protein